VAKSVILNDLERRNGRYIALFQWIWLTCVPHITAASICGGMHESIVLCSTCTMSSYRKFTFAISSPDEFLVTSTLGAIPCKYRHKLYTAKSWILWATFHPQNVSMIRCIFNRFYVIAPKAVEFGKITQNTRPLRHSRSPILVPIETPRMPWAGL